MIWWCHKVLIWWCHKVLMQWCHKVLIWWCHKVLIWWCHKVLIWWCHKVLIWWCHKVLIWWFIKYWYDDVIKYWYDDVILTWWCHTVTVVLNDVSFLCWIFFTSFWMCILIIHEMKMFVEYVMQVIRISNFHWTVQSGLFDQCKHLLKTLLRKTFSLVVLGVALLLEIFRWGTHLYMSLFLSVNPVRPSVCRVPCPRKDTSSDHNFGTHNVKWWYLQAVFSFFQNFDFLGC